MTKMTITEALAELKMIDKRLQSQRQFVESYLWRPEVVVDPHQSKGGSAKLLSEKRQSISDLTERKVAIRLAIQQKNREEILTINGNAHSIAWWLTWRKECAPVEQAALASNLMTIQRARATAQSKGGAVKSAPSEEAPSNFNVVVNVDEAGLSKEKEDLDALLEILDGQFSLKNATTFIEVA